MLKVLLVDDEPPARDELRYLLSQAGNIEIVGEADSGPAALALAATVKPQVVFLDIEMRGMNGCETAVALRALLPGVVIIFTTAYDEYAVRAFEIGAVDYILKPFEGQRLRVALDRLHNLLPEQCQEKEPSIDAILQRKKVAVQKLPVEKNGKIVLVDYHDIIYAHIQSGSTVVITANDSFSYLGTLTEMQERLQGTNFVRVHKSYVVNMDKVKEVIPWFKGTYWLKLEGFPHTEIPVSKSQIKELKEMLGLH